jgi:hypothetical protein
VGTGVCLNNILHRVLSLWPPDIPLALSHPRSNFLEEISKYVGPRNPLTI